MPFRVHIRGAWGATNTECFLYKNDRIKTSEKLKERAIYGVVGASQKSKWWT